MPTRQDEKTAVLRQEKAARTALLNRPSHPGIARRERKAGRSSQQGQPRALILVNHSEVAPPLNARS